MNTVILEASRVCVRCRALEVCMDRFNQRASATPSGFPSRISRKWTLRARKTNIAGVGAEGVLRDHLSLTISELST